MNKEKQELEEVNLQLVDCNDKLVAQLTATSNKLYSFSFDADSEWWLSWRMKGNAENLEFKFNKEL